MHDDVVNHVAGGLKAEEDTSRVIMGRNDYANISQWAGVSTAPVTQISEDLFYYLLNVMPPLSTPVAMGSYFMSEFLTDHPAGPVTIQFLRAGNERGYRFYAKYVVWGAPGTYINSVSMNSPHPLNPRDAEGFV